MEFLYIFVSVVFLLLAAYLSCMPSFNFRTIRVHVLNVLGFAWHLVLEKFRRLKKSIRHLASLMKQVISLRLNVHSLLTILVCKVVVGVLELCHNIIERIVHQVCQHGFVDR